ncbi:MAG TPA: glutaminyl-peptide cyclotransferase, partial [Thermoanaerobaculia bacterium]
MTFIVLAALWYFRSSSPHPEPEPPAQAAAAAPMITPDVPERLKVQVVSTRPHDPGAFTQGLVLDGDTLYESTGLNGKSSLREVDPRTGQVKRRLDIPYEYFAEGLALVDGRLIQ